MIFLHTLGVSAIRVGVHRVLPSATRAFASLIFLGMERHRTVSREELQSLLFPGQGERTASHNLRQLLYRLRGIGAPVVAEASGISLPADAVRDDFTALRDGRPLDAETVKAVAAGVMPGYAPTFSRPFARWIEDRRARIERELLRGLIGRLAELRDGGRWRDLEPVARACLAVDPLNEEATLALAESLALFGQKAKAVQVLDAYIEEVGSYGNDLRVPARVLRTRISEHVPDPHHRRLGPGPFVGRDAEMAELWGHYQQAKRGEARTVVIHGEPGIGKTRLATEFMRAAALDGATCLKVECAPHDVRRPLGVFMDLVPKLLDAPGGLGVAPEAMEVLRKVTRKSARAITMHDAVEAEAAFLTIVASLSDLVDAVASEVPLVLMIDNVDWIDEASVNAIGGIHGHAAARPPFFVLSARARPLAIDQGPLWQRAFWLRAASLAAEPAAQLFKALARAAGRSPAPEIVARCVRTARGNALYLRALAVDTVASPDTGPATSSLMRMLTDRARQLDDDTLRVFVAAAILGRHVTPSRLVAVAGLSMAALTARLHSLETLGFIGSDTDELSSTHPLLSQVAIAELPPLTLRLMHASAAQALIPFGTSTDTALLWEAAQHLEQAGETPKAVEIICSCADHCLQIGQPVVGCELLARAVSLDKGPGRLTILERLIHSARSAGDSSLVREAIRKFRECTATDQSLVCHDDFELFDLEAARLSGGSILEFIPRYSTCLAAHSADVRHRLMAATHLVIAYDLALDPVRAKAAYLQIADMSRPAPPLRDDKAKLDLLYNCFVGSPAKALELSRAVWDRLGGTVPSWRDVPLSTTAGMTMFRCGDPLGGIKVLEVVYRAADRAGISSFIIDIASTLAWMSWVVGDMDGRTNWDRLSDHAFESRPDRVERISHYLSNKIEFAIERGECQLARKWLTIAHMKYGEISVPRVRMVARAFEMRVAQIDGTDPVPGLPLDELARDHERGKARGLHDNFVEAYWHALARAVSKAAANAMLKEYVLHARRDRFPLSPALRAIAPERPSWETCPPA